MGLFFLAVTALWAGTAPIAPAAPEEKTNDVFMHEDFRSLDNWMPYRLFKNKKETVYTPGIKNGVSCVKAESDGSSSALAYKKEFDVYEFPVVKWKWMVANLYPKGNIKKKATNDSPARLYILFKYEPSKAGFFKRIEYALAKTKFGIYPPGSSLCYLWGNHPHKERIITSPAWKNSKDVVLEGGPEHLNEWREEQINIVADYRAAFGIDPPHTAAIAIMNNSDNMGGKATSWFGPIEVLAE
ncbi:MAG: DUF3047 domain-containing protein [Nitrospiraceae bacterium]|nr:DUF3047 domain-containing protein [Nitrospiraceae bacterium]